MKIAFFLDDINNEADYFNEHQPNPGIGGTQFLIWSVSCGLSERNNGLDVILFTKGKAKFPRHLTCVEVQSSIKCIKKCSEMNIDYLVLRSPIIHTDVFDAIDRYKVNTILWAHNFENYRSLVASRKSKYVKKNICVSKEQMDLLLDTELYNKSAIIYNGIWFDEYNYKDHNGGNKICYIGNLYPSQKWSIARCQHYWSRVR